jgi:hypothetical protein
LRKTLYVDVDNVLWDAYPWTLKAVERLWGKKLTLDDVGTWYGWEDLLGPNWFDAFTDSLRPDLVPQREFLPGCVEVLSELDKSGFWLHFVSHNPKPRALYGPVLEWISDNITLGTGDPGEYPHFDLTIFGARNDKIDFMNQDDNAWGIIEDKPSTLRKAVKHGYHTYGRRTGLNKCEDIPGVVWFDHWHELPWAMALSDVHNKEVVT